MLDATAPKGKKQSHSGAVTHLRAQPLNHQTEKKALRREGKNHDSSRKRRIVFNLIPSRKKRPSPPFCKNPSVYEPELKTGDRGRKNTKKLEESAGSE